MSYLSEFIIVLFVLIVWWFVRGRRAKVSKWLPPCIPSLPIVGSLPFMRVDMNQLHRLLMGRSAKYGNIYSMYIGSRYAVVLNGIESIREALVKKSAHFADRVPFFVNCFVNADNKGIAASPYNAAFRRKHQLYTSIFKEFGHGQSLMDATINVEVADLIEQFRLTGGKPFDPSDLFHMTAVNVISSMVFGRRHQLKHPTLVELRRAINSVFTQLVGEIELLPVLRFVPPFRNRFQRLLAAYSRLEECIRREVDIIIWNADNEEDSTQSNNFVRRFIEKTSPNQNLSSLTSADYDMDELLQTLRDLFMAGDDTTATTMRWLLLNLANHRDVQARVQRELDDEVGTERMTSFTDECRLPYTQAVILETMRRHTLLPLSVFHATACDTQLGGYFIPAETMVIVNLYSAHMDPLEWNEPEAFKPERFLDEHGHVTGKEKVVSFSMGKRSCIGELFARQEIFLLLTGILQKFEICPPEANTEVIYDEMTCVVTEPTPFRVRLIERNRSM